jgi:Zn-dependent protease
MRDVSAWSLPFGTWSGVHVRVHMFFLLFAAFACYLSRPTGVPGADPALAWMGAAALGILFVSVLLHEIGHVQMAQRLGGDVDHIVIGPVGGLGPLEMPGEPRRELAAILAGPLVNLAICVIAGAILATAFGVNPNGLLYPPLEPADLTVGSWMLRVMKLTFWINWLLFLVNLLPAFPFDGGRALRAGLQIAWPDWSRRASALTVTLFARSASVVLLVVAFAVRDVNNGSLIPPWFALLLLSIFLFFSVRGEDEEEATGLDSFSEKLAPTPELFANGEERRAAGLGDEDSPEEDELDLMRQWRDERQEAKQRKQREMEAEEEQRVDEILARLYARGMESLSPDDRALLHRVSARYRDRSRSGS